MVCLSKQHDFSYEDSVQEKSAIWLKFRYQRDPIGNRITSTTAESGSPVIRNYTSNNLNQYTTIDNPAASPAYDNDGNTVVCPLSSGLWSLSWNSENRLKEMEKSDAKLDFLYDHMGRRSQKRVYSGSPGAWSLVTDALFVYDGYKLIEELDGQNSDAILRKYVWSGETPFSMTDADGTFYYVLDANKNVSELIDSTGVVRAHYEYSPSGEITVMTGDKAYENPIRFSSEYFDVETGLVYYNFRYYSPELGRWLSRDPIGEVGSIPWIEFNIDRNRLREELRINEIALSKLRELSFRSKGLKVLLQLIIQQLEYRQSLVLVEIQMDLLGKRNNANTDNPYNHTGNNPINRKDKNGTIAIETVAVALAVGAAFGYVLAKIIDILAEDDEEKQKLRCAEECSEVFWPDPVNPATLMREKVLPGLEGDSPSNNSKSGEKQ